MTVLPSAPPPRGRLAPSPTGLLHLGNAWAFLVAWLACRQTKGTLILRLEDIDPERSRPEYAEAIIQDLRWLGLNWDEGPQSGHGSESGAFGPYIQSRRLPLYDKALHRLQQAGLVYPCYCTRKELRNLAGAPHIDERGAPYPGTCRNLSFAERVKREAEGRRPCLRLDCTQILVPFFDDLIQGPQHLTLQECGGDFALRRSDGVTAYQLAVTVDDALMGITQVVRGVDILTSTPRQLALFQALGWRPPRYGHIPLLCDEQGDRLAKRHCSLSLRALAEAGIAPASVIGYLAWKAGLLERLERRCVPELVAVFDWKRLPQTSIRLEPNLEAMLRRL